MAGKGLVCETYLPKPWPLLSVILARSDGQVGLRNTWDALLFGNIKRAKNV